MQQSETVWQGSWAWLHEHFWALQLLAQHWLGEVQPASRLPRHTPPQFDLPGAVQRQTPSEHV
jgi:hypothetical protein